VTHGGAESVFPDGYLVAYARRVYGAGMADRLTEIFGLDPENTSGYASSLRRSFTREIMNRGEGGEEP